MLLQILFLPLWDVNLLQPRNVIPKLLRATSLKCNHQECPSILFLSTSQHFKRLSPLILAQLSSVHAGVSLSYCSSPNKICLATLDKCPALFLFDSFLALTQIWVGVTIRLWNRTTAFVCLLICVCGGKFNSCSSVPDWCLLKQHENRFWF